MYHLKGGDSCDKWKIHACGIRQLTDGGAYLGITLNAVIHHHCNMIDVTNSEKHILRQEITVTIKALIIIDVANCSLHFCQYFQENNL